MLSFSFQTTLSLLAKEGSLWPLAFRNCITELCIHHNLSCSNKSQLGQHRFSCGPVQPPGSRGWHELFYVSDLWLYATCHVLLFHTQDVSIPANSAFASICYILSMALDNLLEQLEPTNSMTPKWLSSLPFCISCLGNLEFYFI